MRYYVEDCCSTIPTIHVTESDEVVCNCGEDHKFIMFETLDEARAVASKLLERGIFELQLFLKYNDFQIIDDSNMQLFDLDEFDPTMH